MKLFHEQIKLMTTNHINDVTPINDNH